MCVYVHVDIVINCVMSMNNMVSPLHMSCMWVVMGASKEMEFCEPTISRHRTCDTAVR